jgi:hypothetical protein
MGLSGCSKTPFLGIGWCCSQEAGVFWTAFQGIFTTLAVVVAIGYPWWQKRQVDLAKLVSIRNIAHYHVRWVKQFVTATMLKNEPIEELMPTYKTCLDALIRTDYTGVSPIHFSEQFLDILTSTAQLEMRFTSYHQRIENGVQIDDSFRLEIKEVGKRLQKDMDRLDQYLILKRVKKDQQSGAFTLGN